MNSQEVALCINVLIYAGILVFSFFKLGKTINVYIVILAIYLLSSIMGIVHFYSPLSDYRNITIFPFLFFASVLLLVLYPLYKFTVYAQSNTFANTRIGGIPDPILQAITLVSLLLCIIPFAENVNAVINGIGGNDGLGSYLAEVHNDRQEGYRKDMFHYTWIGSVSFRLLQIIYEASFALLFYCILKKKKLWYLLSYTFVIVTVNFYQFLLSVRAMLLYTILLLVLYFIAFSSRMSLVIKEKIKKYVLITIIIAISGFVFITLGRSEGNNKVENFALYFVAWYAGEPTLNFNEYIFDRKCTENGDYNFPRFKKKLGLKTFEENYKRRLYYSYKSGVPEQVFYTFFGNFIADFGWFIALFLMIILALSYLAVIRRIKKRHCLTASQLLSLMFLIKFVSCGVFFNPYSGFGNNLNLMYFIMWLIFFVGIQQYTQYQKNFSMIRK